jgi:hypothetical protein
MVKQTESRAFSVMAAGDKFVAVDQVTGHGATDDTGGGHTDAYKVLQHNINHRQNGEDLQRFAAG